MKKTLFNLSMYMLTALMLSAIFYACKKDATNAEPLKTANATMQINGVPTDVCGEPKVVQLSAGKNAMNAGTVTISNDETNLYVTYKTANGYLLKETHTWAGVCGTTPTNNGGNVAPGQFSKNGGDQSTHPAPAYATEYTWTVSLDKIAKSDDGCFCVAAHAALVKLGADGTVIETPTGWGHGENPFPGNQWGWTVNYCVQECTPPPPPTYCYGDGATATGWGIDFPASNNWFEFSAYPQPSGGSIPLISGRDSHDDLSKHIGEINFSAKDADGNVTITIKIDPAKAKLSDVSESVKIQGFATLDEANAFKPIPGQFETSKGTNLVITVPYFAYYGIHLDVNKVTPCPITAP